MDKLQIYLIEIAELFGYKYDDFFLIIYNQYPFRTKVNVEDK